MKTSAVRLQYCVSPFIFFFLSASPLLPWQGVGACNLYHTPTARPGICRLFNVGPIVPHQARHCVASHSCFCVLLRSDSLSLPVFVPPCMAEPPGLWGPGAGGGGFETGVGAKEGGHWVAVFCVCIDYFC